jgi:hypothetical protein
VTSAEDAWIREKGVFSLIVVRAVHVESFLDGSSASHAVGNGATLTFATDADSLLDERGTLLLTSRIEGLPWFGPGEFPVLLASQDATAAAQSLGSAMAAAADRGRQLQLAIPFVLAVFALALDRSPVFHALALLGGARAVRAFSSMVLESPWGEGFVASWPLITTGLLGALNGAVAVSFVLFAMGLAGTPEAIARRVRRALPVLFGIFIVFAYSRPVAWIQGDILADGAGAGFAALLLVVALIRRLLALRSFSARGASLVLAPALAQAQTEAHAQGNSDPEAPGDEQIVDALVSAPIDNRSPASRRRAALERWSYLGSLLVGTLTFGLLAWASAEELLGSGAKALIDWRYALLYPGMLLLAIAKVGATGRIIRSLSGELIRKALLEGELAAAAAQMRAMQGTRKGEAAGVSWRAWQRQCVSVGGDFFDVRPIAFASNETLVFTLVADVTGHGIHAALVANTIGAAWGSWCNDVARERRERRDGEAAGEGDGGFSKRPCPATHEAKEALLRQAMQRIHLMLEAGRITGSATLIVAVLDARDGSFSVCNVGHPQPLAFGPAGHRMLTCPARVASHEVSSSAERLECRTYMLEGETVFLYSDGLFPEAFGVSLPAFMKNPRVFRADPKTRGDASVFWRRYRAVHRHYVRETPDDEDDITLVALRFTGQAKASRAAS